MFKKIQPHIEWMVFLTGLVMLATMDPLSSSRSLCLLEMAGFDWCPGDGLGHSIAFLFRGEFFNAIKANFMGPIAVLVLSSRIIKLWIELFINPENTIYNNTHV